MCDTYNMLNEKRITIEVSTDEKKTVKLKAAKADKTMKDYLLDLVKNDI